MSRGGGRRSLFKVSVKTPGCLRRGIRASLTVLDHLRERLLEEVGEVDTAVEGVEQVDGQLLAVVPRALVLVVVALLPAGLGEADAVEVEVVGVAQEDADVGDGHADHPLRLGARRVGSRGVNVGERAEEHVGRQFAGAVSRRESLAVVVAVLQAEPILIVFWLSRSSHRHGRNNWQGARYLLAAARRHARVSGVSVRSGGLVRETHALHAVSEQALRRLLRHYYRSVQGYQGGIRWLNARRRAGR